MELKPGYKQTEVGVIPEDWDARSIGDFATVATGSTPPTSDSTNYGDEYMFVSPHDMGTAKKIIHTEKRLSKKGFSIARRFSKNSILFVCIGSTIGKCGIASKELTSNQQINAVFPSDIFSSDFIYYALSAAAQRVRAIAGEQAVPLVNKSQFSETTVVFPPLPEQTAIATALSDVDGLLEGLDRLIVKKRDLKQGAMQCLLTPPATKEMENGELRMENASNHSQLSTLHSPLKNIRLPGFEGEWEVKRLGELLSYEQPTNYLVSSSEYCNANNIPVLTAGKTFVLGYTDEKKGIYTNLPVIIFDDFTTASKFVTFPFKVKSSAMKLLRPREQSTNFKLIYEIMQMVDFKLCEHKRYWISEYQKLKVRIPSPAEQTAIATVLSDMDAEIVALEKRRAKTADLKQAMMQELLTGKTRLVN